MDVATSPDGRLAAVRAEDEFAFLRLDGTNTSIIERLTAFPAPRLPFLDVAFDLTSLPLGGGPLSTVNDLPSMASTSGFLAGLDSVVGNNERAVVNSQTRDQVIDLRTLELRLDVGAGASMNGYPWADGVALHPGQAAAFGVGFVNSASGWTDTIDLVSRANLLCRSLPNSTGATAELFALGSTRVLENDLELHASSAPAGVPGFCILGDTASHVMVGGGRLCLQGAVIRLPIQVTSVSGTAVQAVDIPSLPNIGGGVVSGSTWFAQFVFRHAQMAGDYHFSNGSSVLFE